jgi:hypothetical protein
MVRKNQSELEANLVIRKNSNNMLNCNFNVR